MEQKYYKILTSKNTSLERGFDYTPYLPENGNPGKETPFIKDPIPGSEGYHVTPNWLKYLRGRDIDNIKYMRLRLSARNLICHLILGKNLLL